MRARLLGLSVVVGAIALAACSAQPKFNFEPEVCYFVAPAEDGEGPQLRRVADNIPQIELCAARLEDMRLRFLRMGGSNEEITGAYQGRFIFIAREGVSFGQSLDGSRFFALARTGDGRLAIPGAIVRDETGRPVAVAPTPDPAAAPAED